MKSFVYFLLWITITLVALIGLGASATILYLSPKLPNAEVLRHIKLQTPLRIYSQDQQLIGEFGEKRREPIEFTKIPPLFIDALLAAEDQRFFQHNGVDIKGLARAVAQLARTGRKQSGGSTITMQVARNFFLTRKQTYVRKFNEILLALQIERTHSKQEILGLYINKIYLGHRSYGIQAAARVYYGRDIQALSLPELAMIAGLPKAPSRYNPIADPDRALTRRNWILGRMRDLGYITNLDYLDAVQAPVTAKRQQKVRGIYAPYVAEMVRQSLTEDYGNSLYEDGFIVNTTIQSKLQTAARQSVYLGLQAYDHRHSYRGAESKTSIIPDQPEELSLDTYAHAFQTAALDALKSFYTIGNMMPAVVTHTIDDIAWCIAKDGHIYTIDLAENTWAKQLRKPGKPISKAQNMTEILASGDIIRINLSSMSDITSDSDTIKESVAIEETETKATKPPKTALLTQVPTAQAALVAISPEDGAIKALIGGLDFRLSKFNRVIQAGRQAGSSIKPFIYAAALEAGYTAASTINDAPLVFNDPLLEQTWRPQNAGGKFNGPTRLREALYRSRNLVSIRLLKQIGVRHTLNYLEQIGFDRTELPNNLSLALGSASLTPLQLAQAFALFANGGYQIEPYLIDSIYNAYEEPIFTAEPRRVCKECRADDPNSFAADTNQTPQEQTDLLAETTDTDQLDPIEDQGTVQLVSNPSLLAPHVMDERIAFIMRTMLQDVIRKGTGRRAQALNRNDIGGKTGTTNEHKDAWFSGFNEQLTSTVWVGFDEPKTLGKREYGGTAALPIWINFMETALASTEDQAYLPPQGITSVQIDRQSGLAAQAGHNNSVFEWFREEYAPELPESSQPRESKSPNVHEIF